MDRLRREVVDWEGRGAHQQGKGGKRDIKSKLKEKGAHSERKKLGP